MRCLLATEGALSAGLPALAMASPSCALHSQG
jgi:hypothetical protein